MAKLLVGAQRKPLGDVHRAWIEDAYEVVLEHRLGANGLAWLMGSPDAEIVADDAKIEIAHVQAIERLVRHRLDRTAYAWRLGGEAA